jgi:RNA polymerase sigma factor (sigma-70 family)
VGSPEKPFPFYFSQCGVGRLGSVRAFSESAEGGKVGPGSKLMLEAKPLANFPIEEPAGATSVEELFRDHNDNLLRFLRARLRSDADAREAAQEAYVRLLQLDRPDQPSFMRAYLFKVASNVAADIMRRRAVRSRSAMEMADRAVAAEGPDQERSLVAKEQLRIATQAIQALPPKCREAFIMSRHEGCSTVQIGERLNVSDRMVRLYLVRALEHVEAALQNSNSQERR